MARKPTVNLAVPEPLLNEFNAVCRAYGHNKQKGQILSAALMMFLEADPRDQGRWIQEVARADVERGVAALLQRIRQHQQLKVATRDALETAEGRGQVAANHPPGPAGGPAPGSPARPAYASRRGGRKRPAAH
ncbi:MAG: hypothetical protein AAGL98_06360, partial [Planctomycetota bacterium]